jgi:hypothetical protein
MRPYLVSEVIEASKHADIVMMCYNAFISDTRDARRVTEYAHGAIYFSKRVIYLAGGYRPWRCAADTELLQRVAKRVKTYRIEKPLFYRRIHENSLTSCKDTGRTSELRKEYMELIRTYEVDEDIHIDRTTEIFREV